MPLKERISNYEVYKNKQTILILKKRYNEITYLQGCVARMTLRDHS